MNEKRRDSAKAVEAFRDKIDSVRDHTLPAIEEATQEAKAKVEEMRNMTPQPSDPIACTCTPKRTEENEPHEPGCPKGIAELARRQEGP